ncbi:MAG: queuine tRNA-ribosyltransferase queuine tRNA-ribosyltransferase [Candidatus Nomurabacteria bacterium]|nr:queuine tRNA-ribosyltransferase queuine tRNA-ribosyltransferase [Candidatus Nomurabacteria bacterium]
MLKFTIQKKLEGTLGRAGVIETAHGEIKTPAFVAVGTKATVKALTAEQIRSLGAQVVLANTYHLYLQPGEDIVAQAGGFGPFMDWHGPTMTDSGGFQAFSLGAAFGTAVSKIATGDEVEDVSVHSGQLAHVTDEGVTFKSHLDGSKHLFTPESSMDIQWKLGADMIFAFDECTSPTAPYEYQKKSLARTYDWAKRSLARHNELDTAKRQSLFAVIQGGRFQDLREEAARTLGALAASSEYGEGFDGYGIGGSFTKEDIGTAVGWVNALLPEDKPRHLLGIGEPLDLFNAVEAGCDLFDCIAPTRMGRHGTLHTSRGRLNIRNAQFVDQFLPIEEGCMCYTCQHHTRAYLAHLFRADEMTAATLASIHNLHFILRLVENIRESILNDTFHQYKKDFLAQYYPPTVSL